MNVLGIMAALSAISFGYSSYLFADGNHIVGATMVAGGVFAALVVLIAAERMP